MRMTGLCWLAGCWIACCVTGGLSAATDQAGRHPGVGVEESLNPTLGGRISGGISAALARSFALAWRQLEEHDTCRQLFRALGKEGLAYLGATLYTQASALEERLTCGERVTAFTVLGKPRTRLCRRFARLSSRRGAVVLLHEALHAAGLPQSSVAPGALAAPEINHLVRQRCDL